MGTSTSSKGGGSGSPFDPEWLDAVVGDNGTAPADTENADAEGSSNDEDLDSDVDGGTGGSLPNRDENAEPDKAEVGAFSPNRRFAAARTNMSAFLAGGGRDASPRRQETTLGCRG